MIWSFSSLPNNNQPAIASSRERDGNIMRGPRIVGWFYILTSSISVERFVCLELYTAAHGVCVRKHIPRLNAFDWLRDRLVVLIFLFFVQRRRLHICMIYALDALWRTFILLPLLPGVQYKSRPHGWEVGSWWEKMGKAKNIEKRGTTTQSVGYGEKGKRKKKKKLIELASVRSQWTYSSSFARLDIHATIRWLGWWW